jgi:hypothetical protein
MQALKPANERIAADRDKWPSSFPVELTALSASPEVHTVKEAFVNNMGKVRDHVVNNFKNKVAFDDKVKLERDTNRQAAEDQMLADQREAAAAVLGDKKRVMAAYEGRLATERRAMEKMELAKKALEERALKQAEAEHAALEGRLAGQREGLEDAEHRTLEWKRAQARKAFADDQAEKKAFEARQFAANRDAIQRAIAESNKADEMFARSHSAETKLFETGNEKEMAAFNAFDGSDSANGEKMIMREADRYVKDMERLSGDVARSTDAVSSGDYETASLEDLDSVPMGWDFNGW